MLIGVEAFSKGKLSCTGLTRVNNENLGFVQSKINMATDSSPISALRKAEPSSLRLVQCCLFT